MPDPTEDTVLRRLIRDLEKLDPRTRRRIVDYLADRYSPPPSPIIPWSGPEPAWLARIREEIATMTAAARRAPAEAEWSKREHVESSVEDWR